MIIKGKSRAGPQQLAKHLGNEEKNERVRLLEAKGTVSQDLRGALVEMDSYAVGTRCEKSLYHAAISPQPPYGFSEEQRRQAIDALEERLGLVGHTRIVVLHEKLGREHVHIVWSRIDLDRMVSVSDSHNYRKHEEVARELERRFDHPLVNGVHHERYGRMRPERTPSRAEWQQQERTGITGKMVKAEVTAAFQASDGPEAFRAALAQRGYILARGERRDHVVIDPLGGIHSLARRLDGMKAADLRKYMVPLKADTLPSIEKAREIAAERLGKARARLNAQHKSSIEKSYARGEGYVSQTQAALKDHRARQRKLKKQTSGKKMADTGSDDPFELQRKRALEEQEREEGKKRTKGSIAPEMNNYTPQRPPREPHKYRDLRPSETADQERHERIIHEKKPERAAEMEKYTGSPKSREPNRYRDIEMSDEKRARIDRALTNRERGDRAQQREGEDRDPDKQREAPSGGRTRSR